MSRSRLLPHPHPHPWAWRRSAIAAAACLCLVSAALAQQSVGSINGRAAKGDVVTVEAKAIGVSRSVQQDADGSYQFSQLPPGLYQVTRVRADGRKEVVEVSVSAGEGATAVFASMGQQVVVSATGLRTIDTQSTESVTTLSKAQIDAIPVGRDVTAVTLLAPTASFGDSRIGLTNSRSGNVPSLGGASPAENTYYINGFNVTNIVNGVKYSQVPFEGIAELSVKTGGYGAEYGRSLGGVVNVTTQRGTNTWKGGASLSVTPRSLRGSSVYPERNPETAQWELKNRPGGTDETTYTVFGGGPIIKDKLFFFGLVQGTDFKENIYSRTTQTEMTNTSPQFLLKLDWNVNERNFFELTAFNDKSTDKTETYTSPTPYQTERRDALGPSDESTGGLNVFGKWTTLITDDLSVSALYGVGKYNRESSASGADCPFVRDSRVSPFENLGCWTSVSVNDPNAKDERKAFRLDAEWTLGKHRVKAGLDRETFAVIDGSQRSGGIEYQIFRRNPGQVLSSGYVVPGTPGVDPAVELVRTREFRNGGAFDTVNAAWYVEDNIQLTDRVLATVGVRNESFTNKNAAGVPFIDIKNTWAPRFGAAWDVHGDSSLKVYGNAGRYYIPVYANTNLRLSGAETDIQNWYVYAGSLSNDRFQIPAISGSPLGGTAVVSNGITPNALSVVDPHIKPLFQDEFIVGFDKALARRWTVGAKFTHRALKSGMDDICDNESTANWALANGYSADEAGAIGAAIGACFLYNPGGDLTANIDLDGSGTLSEVVIPASALFMPKPKRTYDAIELTFERAWDKKWSLQGSYVLSWSKGNTEGYVKSDVGQDDAGISQDFDYPGLMEGASGYLPNDHRHTLKVFGSYAVTDEWRLGATVLAQSGRPKNCFGVYQGTLESVSSLYGDASFYCDGVLRSRGAFGRLPWTTQLNLQGTYTPLWAKGLTLSVDVLNVFNARTVRGILELEDSGRNDLNSAYGRPIVGSLQPSRAVRLYAKLEF